MESEPVIGVLSGCGGAGASVFAAVLAGLAAARAGVALLIDGDPLGGGLDVLLGSERAPGPRWGQVRVRGGTLDPRLLRESLPRWGAVSVLATDDGTSLDPQAMAAVIAAGRQLGPVVVDLPRWPAPARTAALALCDQMILVSPAEVRGVTASAVIASGLDPGRTSVVVRGSSRSLPREHIGALLGLPVLGELPHDPASLRPVGFDLGKIRRSTRRVAVAVLAHVRARAEVDATEGSPQDDVTTSDRPAAA